MKKKILLLVLFITSSAFSQVEEVKNYEWEANPKFNEIPQEFLSYPAVVLKDYRLYDNRVGNYSNKAFVVKHCAIKILTDNGVNDFNKVSINKKYVRDYRDLRARVIKPNGKIEELPKERIIEKENSDDRQFVFEGVEKGDIVEYYYVIKEYPDFYGEECFQRAIPVIDGKFQINDISDAYGYNGMTQVPEKSHKIFKVTNLPAYKFEPNATNNANLAKVYFFHHFYNYDFTDYFQGIYNYIDGTNARSMVKNFVDDLKLADTSVPLDERLKKMDIFLKTNVELGNQPNYNKVFEDKKITPKMVLNLYKDVLDRLKIKYKIIVSTDKFEDQLDKKHIIPGALSEIMIFVTETQKYMSPFYYWMPYGPAINVCSNNDAIKYYFDEKKPYNIKLNNVYSDFTTITSGPMDDNILKTNSEITIDSDMETVSVNKKIETTGYRSYYTRYYIKTLAEDKMKDYIKDDYFEDVDVDIKGYTISNKEYQYNYDNSKPLTVDTQAQVKENWLENAGKNYLFSIGKVLGKQPNLYQEQVADRKSAVDLYYPKKFVHTIKLNIPKGYTVKTVSNLQFNKQIKDERGEVIGSFISTAKIEGESVQIAIEEFYNFTHLPKERFSDFRDLINTAFDFYKSSLVLTK